MGDDFSALAKSLMPAVVNIATRQTVSRGDGLPAFGPNSPLNEFNDLLGRGQGGARRQSSLGSGFTVDTAGYVVTNNHVIEGADEIDMVISRGRFLAGDYNFTYDEVATIKAACGEAHLKVILETGELHTLDNVRRASDISMYAGGDFIKTSTGKVTPAATLPVTLVMLEAIRDFYYATGKKIGMKPAGGIATAKLALQYLVVVRETLGEAWLNPDMFRFGASKLANDIVMQLAKEHTGVYQSLDYFSKD